MYTNTCCYLLTFPEYLIWRQWGETNKQTNKQTNKHVNKHLRGYCCQLCLIISCDGRLKIADFSNISPFRIPYKYGNRISTNKGTSGSSSMFVFLLGNGCCLMISSSWINQSILHFLHLLSLYRSAKWNYEKHFLEVLYAFILILLEKKIKDLM